jgi:SagB-type dehydrogenase family enzyme
MKKIMIPVCMFFLTGLLCDTPLSGGSRKVADRIVLPEPSLKGEMSIEKALYKRRSVRNYQENTVNLEELSQLLWAAQGITDNRRQFRTAPSAGALYPLEVYAACYHVEEVPPGVYRYDPAEHQLIPHIQGSVKEALFRASGNQSALEACSAVIVISAIYSRTTRKYGDRGIRYVWMEAGHAAQNICLQGTALNLGTVVIGAFSDVNVHDTVKLREDENPLYLIPLGK